jgi:hypothetical protein
MRLVTLRIEKILLSLIKRMADQTDRNQSEVTRDLIDLGIGYQQESPITIQGAFGIKRSFSKLSFGDDKARTSLYIEEHQIEEAMKAFDNNQNGAIREAIRLGFLMLNSEKVIFANPSQELYPFRAFRLDKIQNKRAQKALKQLKAQ